MDYFVSVEKFFSCLHRCTMDTRIVPNGYSQWIEDIMRQLWGAYEFAMHQLINSIDPTQMDPDSARPSSHDEVKINGCPGPEVQRRYWMHNSPNGNPKRGGKNGGTFHPDKVDHRKIEYS
jgi:hypothetical protein